MQDTETPTMRRLRLAVAARKRAVTVETDAILAAVDAGDRQTDIAAAIGRSREHVRLLLRELRPSDGAPQHSDADAEEG